MNRGQLRQLVVGITGRSDKAEVINTALNLGLESITNRHDFFPKYFEEEIAIVEDDSFVELPPRVRDIAEVRLIDGPQSYPLEIRLKTYVAARWPMPDEVSKGKPIVGYVEDGKFHFLPYSDAAYALRFTFIPLAGPLESDTDEPGILGIDNALVAYAAAFVYDSLEMSQEASVWTSRYEMRLLESIRADKRSVGRRITQGPYKDAPSTIVDPWLDPFAKRSL